MNIYLTSLKKFCLRGSLERALIKSLIKRANEEID
jgi:hypothetical protein